MSEDRLEFGDHGELEDEGSPLEADPDPVPPFPQEPAFGSPEADTIWRKLPDTDTPDILAVIEQRDALADALESLRGAVRLRVRRPIKDGLSVALEGADEALRKAGR